jgi:hypothetical protein
MSNAKPFEVKISLSPYAVSSLLCAALEGGSNYWYEIVEYEFPEGITLDDFRKGGRFADPEWYWHPAQIIPLQEGCSVVITDIEDDTERWRLNRAAITRGIVTMSQKYPRHWKNVGTSEEDAETGDVFLQCCLLGEIVYG